MCVLGVLAKEDEHVNIISRNSYIMWHVFYDLLTSVHNGSIELKECSIGKRILRKSSILSGSIADDETIHRKQGPIKVGHTATCTMSMTLLRNNSRLLGVEPMMEDRRPSYVCALMLFVALPAFIQMDNMPHRIVCRCNRNWQTYVALVFCFQQDYCERKLGAITSVKVSTPKVLRQARCCAIVLNIHKKIPLQECA